MGIFLATNIPLGARNVDEIKALAGCDLLTIGPKFLKELQGDESDLPQMLSEAFAREHCQDKEMDLDENRFRWMLNEDAMATEKLAERRILSSLRDL